MRNPHSKLYSLKSAWTSLHFWNKLYRISIHCRQQSYAACGLAAIYNFKLGAASPSSPIMLITNTFFTHLIGNGEGIPLSQIVFRLLNSFWAHSSVITRPLPANELISSNRLSPYDYIFLTYHTWMYCFLFLNSIVLSLYILIQNHSSVISSILFTAEMIVPSLPFWIIPPILSKYSSLINYIHIITLKIHEGVTVWRYYQLYYL